MTTSLLHEFIVLNREEIIRRCRESVATRSIPPPTEAEINHGVPLFLDQLVDALRLGLSSSPQIEKSAVLHGHDRLAQGFTVSQVVQDYGVVCQTVTGLAIEMNAPISTDDFRTLNRCLNEAIAGAVTEYGLGRDQSILAEEVARGSARLGFLTHQARNLAETALLAFDVIKTGRVGLGGSTATVLDSTLRHIRTLMGRPLDEVRLPQAVVSREPFLIAGFIDEIVPAATLEADAHNIKLAVMPVEDGVMVEENRQVLAAVIGNLLKNAFKFTDPRTTVTLRVGTSAERVLIEVEDECGGLLDEDANELFRPFEAGHADRTRGRGVAFSRWGVEANDGRIYARNLREKGCVFTVDLPRLSISAGAMV
jgi:signal transduction histidine kinase